MPVRSLSIAPVCCYTGRGRMYETHATRDLPFQEHFAPFSATALGLGRVGLDGPSQ